VTCLLSQPLCAASHNLYLLIGPLGIELLEVLFPPRPCELPEDRAGYLFCSLLALDGEWTQRRAPWGDSLVGQI
jgi:hypothetical protein